MKKLLYTALFAIVLLPVACKKEKVEEPKKTGQYNSEKINVLVNKYKNFENNYVKAIKENKDLLLIKSFSDSANYYDRLLFSEATLSQLSEPEKTKYFEEINTVRKEKISKMSKK